MYQRLKDNHPTHKKLQLLANLCDDLGISIQVSPAGGLSITDTDFGIEEAVFEDPDEEPVMDFPFTKDTVLVIR